jgi:hypothetical protein
MPGNTNGRANRKLFLIRLHRWPQRLLTPSQGTAQ